MNYDHQTSEKTWSSIWREYRVYEPDLANPKNKFYNLMMFPYPSAEGLHVGNMYAFSGADIYGRYQRMQGKDVLEPIGLDGFGIHSENYAIKIGKHPVEQAKKSQEHFYDQLSKIGDGFAWEERLETYDPAYYKWTQWLFVQMYKHGLAYKASSFVNWCPSCKTVLADEQVEDGKCERCKSEVGRKEAKQWFFKITNYADRLLENIKTINWPEKIKIAQRQWIGKSKGLNIDFAIEGMQKPMTVWTKFWETVFGVTFLVIAPEFIDEFGLAIPAEKKQEVDAYVIAAKNKTEQQRKIEAGSKTGVFTGVYAKNPVNGKNVPIWVADYVLSGVGTGAVMGVPAHDERDFDFAQKFGLENIQVVAYDDPEVHAKVSSKSAAYEGDGKLMNSAQFDGKSAWGEGKQEMAQWMIEQGFAKWFTTYHLRDWLISRQRFWGPPIPMVECDMCGWQPVPEDQLPIELPFIDDYKPTGDGKSPLEKAPESWLYTTCPNCGGKAKRETDVSDTFLDSSWYFLRYPSLKENSALCNAEITKNWLPVDAYIGGAEHAVLHLLYARFVTMALHDWNVVSFDEPFPFLFGHGLIIKDGAKMSKSRGNVVNPDEYIEKFGADTLRTYLMFLGPYDQGGDFRDTGIAGMYRWIQKVWRLFHERVAQKSSTRVLVQLQKTIKKCTQDIAEFHFNTSIASMMECANSWSEEGESLSWEDAEKFLKLLAPFAPFMTEEIYQEHRKTVGQDSKFSSIHRELWPTYDASLLTESTVEIVVQVNGKIKDKMQIDSADAQNKDLLLAKAKALPKIAELVAGKTVKKEVAVPGRLVNLVIG